MTWTPDQKIRRRLKRKGFKPKAIEGIFGIKSDIESGKLDPTSKITDYLSYQEYLQYLNV